MGFHKIILDISIPLFDELAAGSDFESVAKGRIGNHLVSTGEQGIPVVRTTTQYNIPANDFSTQHHKIVAYINEAVSREGLSAIPLLQFNNALIEVYDETYWKMNYHSDQCLDIEDDTYIGVFSCYEHPDALTAQHMRKLKMKDKATGDESEYALTHHSVILFSTATNKQFQHKIVLDAAPNPKSTVPDNRWLGITFRVSKTYLRFKDGLPCFTDGSQLILADKEQASIFYKLRGQENSSLDFEYPPLNFTVNPADLMLPVKR
ncbi:hypothetical protein [Chitinophaga rhizophila]|uniref:2-oxoglutarate-Fe(II)-dependent oxygenase superfamily protein n=1 Tax=Chitinophaga rhizophila TaxID=2866212 RepID=A0ABS7GC25_9BACT|nr:hypothetical protein [Chitinophaga rhizophila]MBW8685227.1 hypothetical protein [Chitinophaga rhizophila]